MAEVLGEGGDAPTPPTDGLAAEPGMMAPGVWNGTTSSVLAPTDLYAVLGLSP
ncbi:hypothetical protein [Pedococcus sp. 5OH_020]|uniref:hypothetical protein n=1 Tax=Pedococcus sp. 5OH_020 TaxID=2989814 RepID=UPI0022E9F7BD|nr:hypothetical protein [Pedococcus sp. 5OH_020]